MECFCCPLHRPPLHRLSCLATVQSQACRNRHTNLAGAAFATDDGGRRDDFPLNHVHGTNFAEAVFPSKPAKELERFGPWAKSTK
jgi:hypothetical protein